MLSATKFRAVSRLGDAMFTGDEIEITFRGCEWSSSKGLASANGDTLRRFAKEDKNGKELYAGDVVGMLTGEPGFDPNRPDLYLIVPIGAGLYLHSLETGRLAEPGSIEAWDSEDMTLVRTADNFYNEITSQYQNKRLLM